MRPQCLGSQFAPMAARYCSCSSKDIAHVRGVWLVRDWKSLAYFAARGVRDKSRPWRRAMARAYREDCARPRPSAWALNSRCVAARDKSRPGRRAMARAHQEGCARARGVAGRGLEKPGILRGAWPHGTSRAHGGGLWPALIKRVVHVRGLVPGFSIRGAWPHGTSRARGGGLWPALIKRVAHVRGPVPGFSIRGAWPHGTSCARDGGLMARAYRENCARPRGVVGRGLEKLSHWGVWPGAVHLDWSKSPRWMGARRCAGVSFPGWVGRKQVWAELFPR